MPVLGQTLQSDFHINIPHYMRPGYTRPTSSLQNISMQQVSNKSTLEMLPNLPMLSEIQLPPELGGSFDKEFGPPMDMMPIPGSMLNSGDDMTSMSPTSSPPVPPLEDAASDMIQLPVTDYTPGEFLDFLHELQRANRQNVKRIPIVGHKELDMHHLYLLVESFGGLNYVVRNKLFKEIAKQLGLPSSVTNAGFVLRKKYEKLILPYEAALKAKFGTTTQPRTDQPAMHVPFERAPETSHALKRNAAMRDYNAGMDSMRSMPGAVGFPVMDFSADDMPATDTPVYLALKSVLEFFVQTFGISLDRLAQAVCSQEMALSVEEKTDTTPLVNTLRPVISFLSSLPAPALPFVFHAWPLATLPLLDVASLDDDIMLRAALNPNVSSVFIGASPTITGLSWPRAPHLRHLKVIWEGFTDPMLRAAIDAYPGLQTLTLGDCRALDLSKVGYLENLYRLSMMKLKGSAARHLEAMARQLPNLTILKLSFDPMEKNRATEPTVAFPQPGSRFPNIKEMCLSNCREAHLPNLAAAFHHLTRLSLCHSRIIPLEAPAPSSAMTGPSSVATNCGLEVSMPRLQVLALNCCSGQLSTALPETLSMTLQLNLSPGVHELPQHDTAPHREVSDPRVCTIAPVFGGRGNRIPNDDIPSLDDVGAALTS